MGIESIFEFLKPFIESLLGQNSHAAAIVVSIAAAIGMARIIFKPAYDLAKVIIAATKTQKDDELLVKIERSKYTAAALYLLNFIFSIKAPEHKPANELKQ